MDTYPNFRFDLKQQNTLKASGLAAMCNDHPSTALGGFMQNLFGSPNWMSRKWAYQVQYFEVTFESYHVWEEYQAQRFDDEIWDVLMVTAHSSFLTDELRGVEMFFAHWTDRPEFVQHPDRVSCPLEYTNKEYFDRTPIRWNLVRRAWVALLLRLQQTDAEVVWNEPERRFQGRVSHVGLHSFDLTTSTGVQSLLFGDRYKAQIYRVHEDGYIQMLWTEPTARTALDPESLPVWNYARAEWRMPEEHSAGH